MNESIENIIGNIVEINNRKYIISESWNVHPNGPDIKQVDHFGVKLIALDKLSKPIQEVPTRKKIKGIAIQFSEEQIIKDSKVSITKVLDSIFHKGLVETKRALDNAKNGRVLLEMPELEKSPFMLPETYLRDMTRHLEERLQNSDFTTSFYY